LKFRLQDQLDDQGKFRKVVSVVKYFGAIAFSNGSGIAWSI
jgi:hypothetical protein